MIIAVTSKDGEVFQHFGHSEEFTLFEVENGTVIETKKFLQMDRDMVLLQTF